MTALLPYTRVFRGVTPATALHRPDGSWPPVPEVPEEPGFRPQDIDTLVTWLDAADYLPGLWPNRTEGDNTVIAGAPAAPPAWSQTTQNGMPVVRFRASEGRLRSTWLGAPLDWTLVYLMRWIGPGIGRAFSVQYPPSNLLVGMHTTRMDAAYFNGGWQYGPVDRWRNDWRLYSATSSAAEGARFFVDGEVQGGPYIEQYGLTGGWGISGYENSSAETVDIEVAELVLYNRGLEDTERRQVESYLLTKWGLV